MISLQGKTTSLEITKQKFHMNLQTNQRTKCIVVYITQFLLINYFILGFRDRGES